MVSGEQTPVAKMVVAGVITAAVIGAFSFIPQLWSWVTGLTRAVWHHLLSNASIDTWKLYSLYFLSVVGAMVLFKPLIRAVFNKANGPTFHDYTEDSFFGLTWRWQYSHNRFANVWAFCPACETTLVYSYDRLLEQVALHCETCAKELHRENGDREYLVAKVERQIDRKIRTGEWRSVVGVADDK